MRSFGLGISKRRLWQPIWLPVVLTPLVALPCGAVIDQPPADGQDHPARREVGGRPRDSQKTWENGDDRIRRPSAAGRQIGSVGRSSRGGNAQIGSKAARPSGKPYWFRRAAERCLAAPLAGLIVVSPGAAASGCPAPKARDALFAEHALLRRLEL